MIVTQTLEDVEEYCNKVAVMLDGSLIEFTSISRLFEKYTSSYTLRVFPNEPRQNAYKSVSVNSNITGPLAKSFIEVENRIVSDLPFCRRIPSFEKDFTLHKLIWPYSGTNMSKPLLFNFDQVKEYKRTTDDFSSA